jgi:hypothetical protein
MISTIDLHHFTLALLLQHIGHHPIQFPQDQDQAVHQQPILWLQDQGVYKFRKELLIL